MWNLPCVESALWGKLCGDLPCGDLPCEDLSCGELAGNRFSVFMASINVSYNYEKSDY